MTQYTDTPPFTGMIEIPIMAISGVHIYLDPWLISGSFPAGAVTMRGRDIVAQAEPNIRRAVTVQIPGLVSLLHIHRRSRELEERTINVIVQVKAGYQVPVADTNALGWLCAHIAKEAVEDVVNGERLAA